MSGTQAIPGLDLHLELAETRPARALETALRDAISNGRLPAGQRLPPTRGLAADLGIARATVSEVYAQLTAEGWLEARVGSGTWVAASSSADLARVPGDGHATPAGPRPGLRVAQLYGGLPDPSLFPRREWLAAARRAVDTASVAELGYADPRGTGRLRQQLSGYLGRTRGVQAPPGRLLIGHGFGGLLSLTCRTLVARGARRIAVEEYGHPEHRDILRAAGLEPVPLRLDDEGADVGGTAQASRLAALGADAVLLTTAHQFPMGVPLSPRRRRAVISWARATGGVVIEDDYDGEFRYERRAVGALQAISPDHVIYIGTASKALAPGVGLAWAVAPRSLLDAMLRERSVLDVPRDALNQLTLAEFLAAHAYDRHVRRMRAEYRRRREFLVDRLAERAPSAYIRGVAAGLQSVVMLPAGTDQELVIAQAFRRGLSLRSLADYAAEPDRDHPPAIVLGYGASPASRALSDIEMAVAAIAAGIAATERAPELA